MKPSSLQEAISIIKANFPVDDLKAWAALSKEKALLEAHFGLGVWVRNKWVHGKSPLTTKINSIARGLHDDDISTIVIGALWSVLNGAPCPELRDLLLQFPRYPESKLPVM